MKKASGFIVFANATGIFDKMLKEIIIMNKAITREVKRDCDSGEYHSEMQLTKEEQEIFEKYHQRIKK